MEHREVAVVRALLEAFNDGALDSAAGLVSDDFELVDIASGQTLHGPEGCREWLGVFKTALPDARIELVNVFSNGTRVATEHIGRGTHRGPFLTPAGTIPATDRPVELRVAELFEVKAEKITSLHAYYDSATLLRQLGLLPAQGSSAERGMTSLMAFGVNAQKSLRRIRH